MRNGWRWGGYLAGALLALVATLRPGTVALGVVVDGAEIGGGGEARGMAIRALWDALRPDDELLISGGDGSLLRGASRTSGTPRYDRQGLDLNAAVSEAARRLAEPSARRDAAMLVMVGRDGPALLGPDWLSALPRGASVRLVGVQPGRDLVRFCQVDPWQHDLRVAPASSLPEAAGELRREIQWGHRPVPTPATWLLLAGSLLLAAGCLARARALRRRGLAVLIDTGGDLDVVFLAEGAPVHLAGRTLLRDGGRVRLLGPPSAGRECWLQPGDEAELQGTGRPVRISVVRLPSAGAGAGAHWADLVLLPESEKTRALRRGA